MTGDIEDVHCTVHTVNREGCAILFFSWEVKVPVPKIRQKVYCLIISFNLSTDCTTTLNLFYPVFLILTLTNKEWNMKIPENTYGQSVFCK